MAYHRVETNGSHGEVARAFAGRKTVCTRMRVSWTIDGHPSCTAGNTVLRLRSRGTRRLPSATSISLGAETRLNNDIELDTVGRRGRRNLPPVNRSLDHIELGIGKDEDINTLDEVS